MTTASNPHFYLGNNPSRLDPTGSSELKDAIRKYDG